MNKILSTIVIPSYKEIPDDFEEISLKQSTKVLRSYHFSFVIPESLNATYYVAFCEKNNLDYSIEHFDDKYFSSIDGYNRLMLNLNFYRRFVKYKYMLICQLDAFIFRDELKQWCLKNYDYIGAPWFEGFDLNNNTQNILGVGNGGLSLRKTATFLDVLSKKDLKLSINGSRLISPTPNNLKSKILLEFKVLLKRMGYRNNYRFFQRNPMNEDVLFCNMKYKLNMPRPEEAMQFAFDGSAETLYKLNNKKLPFGCHAWYKYGDKNLQFWQSIMKDYLE